MHFFLENFVFSFQSISSQSADHYSDVIMGAMASQITSLTIVIPPPNEVGGGYTGFTLSVLYSSVYSGTDQRKHQSSASLAFVRGIHRRPVNSPHKGPVTRKMFPFDDIIMSWSLHVALTSSVSSIDRQTDSLQVAPSSTINYDMLL